FQKFAGRHADSPLLPQVEFAIARTYERQGNWTGAATNEESWLAKYPTHEMRPQVEYARAWAVFQGGDEAAAFDLFNQFIKENPPNHPPAALAYWGMGHHYFPLGGTNLLQAEVNYETIFQDFPTNELAFRAQLMAGRAAMGRFQYTTATNYFVTLIS